jgi:RNA polymerase sigma factor (sigma-70 family)
MNHLLARAREGDKSAEKQLFEYLFVRFRLFAKHRVRQDEEAEDIAQEACITVLEKYKTETFTEGFEAWAYGVLKMKIGNHLQIKAARQGKIVSQSVTNVDAGMFSPSSDPDFRRQLFNCLKKILKANRRYARALNLVYQGYKTDEICRKLKISRSNFYVTLNRGRSMLRICLETGEV